MGYGMLDIGYLYCSWVRDIDMVVDGCSGSGGWYVLLRGLWIWWCYGSWYWEGYGYGSIIVDVMCYGYCSWYDYDYDYGYWYGLCVMVVDSIMGYGYWYELW